MVVTVVRMVVVAALVLLQELAAFMEATEAILRMRQKMELLWLHLQVCSFHLYFSHFLVMLVTQLPVSMAVAVMAAEEGGHRVQMAVLAEAASVQMAEMADMIPVVAAIQTQVAAAVAVVATAVLEKRLMAAVVAEVSSQTEATVMNIIVEIRVLQAKLQAQAVQVSTSIMAARAAMVRLYCSIRGGM